MNIAILRGDASVEALAQRIYGDAAKERPELIQELRDANPHLENLNDLPDGTPVLVPPSGDPKIDDVSTAADPQLEAAMADLAGALNDFEQRRSEVLTERQETFAESARLASSQPLRDAGGRDVVAQLDSIVRDTATLISDVGVERKALADDLLTARTILHPVRRRPS
ncbi:MAG TPA: hypothetical protein VHX14_14760 [Thermoanaerobaculia bacterium]|nr:hypothetical protein [Thermoanaerobaculia bacterium]